MEVNRYPWWKNGLVIGLLIIGILYALPNFYGQAPSLQIEGRDGVDLTEVQVEEIKQVLIDSGIDIRLVRYDDFGLSLGFFDSEQQHEAQSILTEAFDNSFVVALHRLPLTPDWLRGIGATPINLGLDLRGGVRFLLEVDFTDAYSKREEAFSPQISQMLRDDRIRYRGVTVTPEQGIRILFTDVNERAKAIELLQPEFNDLIFTPNDEGNSYILTARLNESLRSEIDSYTIEQSMTTLRNRVNELGVAETVVQRQGSSRISVELPGVEDTTRAKELIGKTATLEFYLQDSQNSPAGPTPAGSKRVLDNNGQPVLFIDDIVLSGDQIVHAQAGRDQQNNLPAVFIRVGGNVNTFNEVTGRNVGRLMGTVYIETDFVDREVNGEIIRVPQREEVVINVATIQQALGNSFQITGIGSMQEAQNLALLLRSGALPAALDYVEERTIGPSLGAENVEMGMRSLLIGLALVIVFMTAYYGVFGIIANICLLANLFLLVALLSSLGAVLTLPGIAGIVLTLGMAVDANVLIFERIREEIRKGAPYQTAIHRGYDKALVTILDANLTTFVVALVLFSIGSGPIKGFAVTLSFGLVTSVFTAVMVSRACVNALYGSKRLKRLPIGI